MIWKPVIDTGLMNVCSSLQPAFFESERWFSHRGISGQLKLVDMLVFQPDFLRDGWFCFLLLSVTSTTSEDGGFFYFIPLWIIRGEPEERPLFIKDGYSFFDGIHTPYYYSLIQQGFLEQTYETLSGQFVFFPESHVLPFEGHLHGSSSNSLLFVSQRFLIKNYRLVFPGINPELELNRALSRKGAGGIPKVYGSLGYQSKGVHYTLAMVQEWVAHQGSGWEVWQRLLVEQGMDFRRELLQEAFALGKALGGFQQELAQISQEQKCFNRFTVEMLAEKVDSLENIINHTLKDESPAEADAAIGKLKKLEQMLTGTALGYCFRIHGDLHLEQVLKTDSGWLIIDLEGEPLKPIHERGYYDSPLKDVASMLRSFSYRIHGFCLPDEEQFEAELTSRFWDGYVTACDQGRQQWLPELKVSRGLLELFQLERVVYELNYELKYRPDWAVIPRNGLKRLVREE